MSERPADDGGPATDNPWEWRDGVNPYRSTPFQILDLPPTLTGGTEIRARVQRRRRRIERGAERFPLFGRVLTVADVNRAEELVNNVETRLRAELLTHRPAGDVELPSELLDTFAELPTPTAPTPAPVVDVVAARSLLPDVSAAAGRSPWEELLP